MTTTEHAVVIAGGGPTGMMLAAELTLASVDVAIVEPTDRRDLDSSRAGGLHARTIEVFDQRGIADRFLAEGQQAQVVAFGGTVLDIGDFPTRHPYGLALWQKHIERIMAGWVDELAVPILRGREVTGFAQDDAGVDVDLSDGGTLRARYLVGCDGANSTVRRSLGIGLEGKVLGHAMHLYFRAPNLLEICGREPATFFFAFDRRGAWSNIRIIDLAVAKLGLPREKMLANIDRVGNTSSASIPILLDQSVREGKVRPGDRVLMCALGAGISWGSAVVTV